MEYVPPTVPSEETIVKVEPLLNVREKLSPSKLARHVVPAKASPSAGSSSQATIINPITVIVAIIPMSLNKFFIKNSFL
jgi:hypothetical protein